MLCAVCWVRGFFFPDREGNTLNPADHNKMKQKKLKYII